MSSLAEDMDIEFRLILILSVLTSDLIISRAHACIGVKLTL
jgi:hypothetical protein